MRITTVNRKKININLFRLDSEYHVGIAKINMARMKGYTLDELCNKVVQGPNPTFIAEGIPSLNGKNVYFGTLDAGEPNYISNEEYESLKPFQLQADDILITLKHASRVGRLWIYRGNKKCLFSRNLGLIRLKKTSPICHEALLIYLWGLNTQELLNLIATGGTNGQITLSMTELREFPIPKLSEGFQNQLRLAFKVSEELFSESKNTYNQSQHYLLSELGLFNWQGKQNQTFIKNYSDTQHAERIDAEYFQPKYEEIDKAIKKYSNGYDMLGNLASIIKCIEVGSEEYLDEGIPFIRVSDISTFEITEEKYISEDLYFEMKQYQPKQGEILLSKDATPGIAYYLRERPRKMIPSGGILRLKLKDDRLDGDYLTLVLNSLIVKEQINRDVGGSVILHWRPDQVKETLIPILSKIDQDKIKEKIIQSFNLRNQSKHLLECAKRAVEIAIEQDEETAIKWLQDQTINKE
jgi:type I restriction enzyme, S subunit